MDVFYAYTWGTAAWLSIQAVPLIVSPTIITALISPEVREPTPLEEYFSRSLGFALLAIAVLNILLTGSVPLTSSLADTTLDASGVPTESSDPKAPYALPTLTITTTYQSAIAFYCYTQFNTKGSYAFALACGGYGGLAAVGLWCILFASSSGRISKKTLIDKRTSNWPFKNSEAYQKESLKKKAENEKAQ